MLTLGDIYRKKLDIAVSRGLITETQKCNWLNSPPISKDEYDHIKFILTLINEAEAYDG